MKLYFLRHAEAHDGENDAARELTPHGRLQAAAVARFLRRADVEFNLAYTSPLVRARQTAEAVLAITNEAEAAKIKLQSADSLLNEPTAAEFFNWLDTVPATAEHVLLVGHAPSLSDRVRQLLAIKNTQSFAFAKGALACLKHQPDGGMALKFHISPKVLGV